MCLKLYSYVSNLISLSYFLPEGLKKGLKHYSVIHQYDGLSPDVRVGFDQI